MDATKTFECALITPEHQVLECPATFVAFPAWDGEVGILAHRAPLVCKMGIGPLRIEASGQSHLFFVDGGFAQMVADRLTILTEQAKRANEIDTAKADKALDDAHAMKITDQASFEARDKAIRRALSQLKLSKS